MIEKVRDWLKMQGYPLEMRTASAFRRAGFEIRQSSYYLDPETGNPREIDVLAMDPDFLGVVGISFVVECKATKGPWVLLCSTDVIGFNRLFAFAVTSKDGRAALSDHFEELHKKLAWLRKDDLTGYAIRQAFSQNDVAYAAAMGVAKASDNHVREFARKFGFAFPVIVIDGPLIRCSLDENDQVHLEETDQGEFLFHGATKGISTCIRVVTAASLPAFAMEAKQVADQLRAELKSEEDSVRASWRT